MEGESLLSVCRALGRGKLNVDYARSMINGVFCTSCSILRYCSRDLSDGEHVPWASTLGQFIVNIHLRDRADPTASKDGHSSPLFSPCHGSHSASDIQGLIKGLHDVAACETGSRGYIMWNYGQLSGNFGITVCKL